MTFHGGCTNASVLARMSRRDTTSRHSPPIPALGSHACPWVLAIRQRPLPASSMVLGHFAWRTDTFYVFGWHDWCEIACLGERMSTRRINSRSSSRRPYHRPKCWLHVRSAVPNMQRLVPVPTADSPSSHTAASGQTDARVLRKLGAFLWPGSGAISLPISRYTSIRSPTRYISQTYDGPAAAFTCLRPSSSSFQSATSRILHHITEMVVTSVGNCQFTARRILAEIQLRINGFNTYG
jgi:hypothetical protein